MMEAWSEIEFTKSILQNAIGRGNQINASEILESGKYPVIDQGKSFIAGYTNDEERLIKDGFPYVIFGDHTRCFKYVDFPFVIGADGTKVLSPNIELFDPYFFFFQLLSLDISNRGYNRHFKLLKEKILKIPPIPEQNKIAYVLSTIQKAIEQQDKLIKTTTELKKALMQKLFTEGLYGEKQKQTEIGHVPESWEVVNFPMFVLLQRGKDLTKKNFQQGKIPVAGSSGIIGFHNKSCVKGPGVTVGRSGSCGNVSYYKENFWAHNTSLYVKDFNGNYELFSFYYLVYLNLSRFKTGVSVPTLDRNSLNTYKIPVPSYDEQVKIAETIGSIEKKIEHHKSKKKSFSDLFKTLLHELMTGQKRVNEIDFENKKEELLMAAEPEIKYNK